MWFLIFRGKFWTGTIFWVKRMFFSPIKKCRRRRKCSSVAQWNQNRFEIGPVQARSKNPFFIRILDIWAASWFPFYGKNVLLSVQYPTKGFPALLKYFIDKRRDIVSCFSSHSDLYNVYPVPLDVTKR